MSERKKLQEALAPYVDDTFSYIHSVRGFCEKISEWVSMRKTEGEMMMYIKNKADKVKQSRGKVQAFKEYMKSKETQFDADPGEQLAVVLKDTLRGMEELNCFLDAVEKLAVTSLNVFMKNQVLHLTGIKFEYVQFIIAIARIICPLLLSFKRDAQVFFLPNLQNVEVLSNQLDIYIKTTQTICKGFKKSFFDNFGLKTTIETKFDLDVNLSEDDITRMLNHINQLHDIRMNQHLRTVLLFEKESCSSFISEFKKRQPRMLQCLEDLEQCAVQLDKMNKGSKISSVAGSSVGAVGGVLSIIGLALIPVTFGASLGLTITGLGLGVASGVNSAVTTATELGVNATQKKKASESFKVFMEDVQVLQGCLDEVISQAVSKMEADKISVSKVVEALFPAVYGVGKGIRSLIREVSCVKLLHKGVISGAQRATAEISQSGQAAAKGSLALSKSARAGAIAVNALFIGMDIFFICKDSISLAKGSETKVSQFIRARSAVWRSEIDSWQKMHDSLCEGLQTSERKKDLLDTPFYSELDLKKE